MTMKRYTPYVTCWDKAAPSDLGECHATLQSMPASKDYITFGTGGTICDFTLPKSFAARESKPAVLCSKQTCLGTAGAAS